MRSQTILKVATRVPDHGRLAPWRFILYRGESREMVGRDAGRTGREARGTAPGAAAWRKERTRFFARAPTGDRPWSRCRRTTPRSRNGKFGSCRGAAAAMNLMIAANALGYRTNWVSNWFAEDKEGLRPPWPCPP